MAVGMRALSIRSLAGTVAISIPLLAFCTPTGWSGVSVLQVTMDRSEFVEGQPISVNLEIRNETDDTLELPFPSLNSIFARLGVDLTDASGQRIKTIFVEYGAAGRIPHVFLPPGKSATGFFNLNDYVWPTTKMAFPRLGPGTYALVATLGGTFHGGQFLRFEGSARFSITRASGEDSVALYYLRRAQIGLIHPDSAGMFRESLLAACPKSALREEAYLESVQRFTAMGNRKSDQSSHLNMLQRYAIEFPDSPFLWDAIRRVPDLLAAGGGSTVRDSILSTAPLSRAAAACRGEQYPVKIPVRATR